MAALPQMPGTASDQDLTSAFVGSERHSPNVMNDDEVRSQYRGAVSQIQGLQKTLTDTLSTLATQHPQIFQDRELSQLVDRLSKKLMDGVLKLMRASQGTPQPMAPMVR